MTRLLAEADADRLLEDAERFRLRVVVDAEPVDESGSWATPRGDTLHAEPGDWWVIDGDERWSMGSSRVRRHLRTSRRLVLDITRWLTRLPTRSVGFTDHDTGRMASPAAGQRDRRIDHHRSKDGIASQRVVEMPPSTGIITPVR